METREEERREEGMRGGGVLLVFAMGGSTPWRKGDGVPS